MRKLLLALLVLAFLFTVFISQPIFAQQALTPAEIAEMEADPDIDVIRNPDGSIEIRKKQYVFEEITIPKEIFLRDRIGYEKPILDDRFIQSPNEVSKDPGVIGTNALLAILIFLVVGLACFMFNNVIEAHGDDINKFAKKIPVLNLFDESNKNNYKFLKKLILLIFLVLFGLIAAHITPEFNLFEQKNLGILIITVATIIIATYSKDILRFIIARREDWDAFFKPNLLGFFLAIICVVLSRVLEIPPGYLFGIPVGLFIISKHFDKKEGPFEFKSLSWMFFMALVVWFLTPLLREYEVFYDTFNLLYVILLEGLFFELFPITYLPGKAIYKWSKFAWASIFGSVSFLLLHTLFNPNSTISTIADSAPTKNTLIILGVFVAVCFAVWGVARISLMFKKA